MECSGRVAEVGLGRETSTLRQRASRHSLGHGPVGIHIQEHLDTLTSMDTLAGAYIHQGRQKEAEERWLQLMRLRRMVLGQEHPDTLMIKSNLVYTYNVQGRWKEVKELGLRVMEATRKILGEEHRIRDHA